MPQKQYSNTVKSEHTVDKASRQNAPWNGIKVKRKVLRASEATGAPWDYLLSSPTTTYKVPHATEWEIPPYIYISFVFACLFFKQDHLRYNFFMFLIFQDNKQDFALLLKPHITITGTFKFLILIFKSKP